MFVKFIFSFVEAIRVAIAFKFCSVYAIQFFGVLGDSG